MTTDTKSTSSVIKTRPERVEIGNGLIMRWSTPADVKNIADTMAECFKWIPIVDPIPETEEPGPNQWVYTGVLRLLRGNSKVMDVTDYAIVENTLAKPGENPIVACTCLMKGQMYYGKVDLNIGQPEAVGCLPEYRNKGLIRRLFLDMIHPASEARGDLIQYLPGIAHFYLQFGYEYALGQRTTRLIKDVSTILSQAGPERGTTATTTTFTLREPTLDDIPFLLRMSTPAKMMNQATIGTYYDEDYWQYTIHDLLETADSKLDITRTTRVIVDAKTGQDAGVVMVNHLGPLYLNLFSLEEGYLYRDALYPVLKQIVAAAAEPNRYDLRQAAKKAKEDKEEDKEEEENVQKEQQGDNNVTKDKDGNDIVATTTSATTTEGSSKPPVTSLCIALDSTHPVYQLLESQSEPMDKKFRLYTRIPSYARFLEAIAPTLEERLAQSCLRGISCTFHFDFFRKVEGSAGKMLELVLENGKIVSASDDYVEPSPREKMMAARERALKQKETGLEIPKPLQFRARFAPLSLTRLIVGDLSLDEMLYFYGQCDVQSGDEAKLLLNILFPKSEFHLDFAWW
ncbi:hypothetical protein BGZ94_001113 [Podila epigama]|nr:hypothetical protein BGZ94_001113 [Podila epigama]